MLLFRSVPLRDCRTSSVHHTPLRSHIPIRTYIKRDYPIATPHIQPPHPQTNPQPKEESPDLDDYKGATYEDTLKALMGQLSQTDIETTPGNVDGIEGLEPVPISGPSPTNRMNLPKLKIRRQKGKLTYEQFVDVVKSHKSEEALAEEHDVPIALVSQIKKAIGVKELTDYKDEV